MGLHQSKEQEERKVARRENHQHVSNLHNRTSRLKHIFKLLQENLPRPWRAQQSKLAFEMWEWYPRKFKQFETSMMNHLLRLIAISNLWRRAQQSKLTFEILVWYSRKFKNIPHNIQTSIMNHLPRPLTISINWRSAQQSKLAFEMWEWYPRKFKQFETSMMNHLLRLIAISNLWRRAQQSKLTFEMWEWFQENSKSLRRRRWTICLNW